MRLALLTCALLGTVCFGLSAWLEPWFQGWTGNRARSGNLLSTALGDSRRLFAKHFYVKADAYFHSGYYPTIYDNASDTGHTHMAAASGAAEEKSEKEADFLGKPKDWIDAFSRHFYPSSHRHLGEADEAHSHDAEPGHHSHEEKTSGDERELLPWLRLSASLDPEQPETYIIASFWLRSRLGKANEAEQFLREGLQANPGHYEILLELGHIYKENRHDPGRARNVWELALRNWREKEAAQPEPNIFPYAQILGNLATLEEEQQDYAKAVEYLRALKQVSPNKASLERWIGALQAKQAQPAQTPP
jgi:tetratricopeptide (TPR) repeat protein